MKPLPLIGLLLAFGSLHAEPVPLFDGKTFASPVAAIKALERNSATSRTVGFAAFWK